MSDDIWTTISRKKGSRTTHSAAPAINGADSSITIEQLQQDFERKLKVWQASSCRKLLFQLLKKNAPDDGWKIERAVCLATGSFSTFNSELNRRSVLQLASFVDLAREMGDWTGEKIEMFAQEPKYARVDEEFLAALGVKVLRIEAAIRASARADSGLGPVKRYLSSSTAVCDFFLSMDSTATTEFFAAEHGLYIGTPFEQAFVSRDVELRLARDRFEEDYERRKLPILEEEPGVFEGLMIYWRRPKDDEDVDG